ncbi:hypothetical protein ACEN2I_19615 [Flavobacterium sp. W22_SRS_FK3]|uniref:hypothetical protein n=1 Tax=Flavobacterium sp. W22_SRS_FK3 TaxID=3240275 RepID=UPI003F923A08
MKTKGKIKLKKHFLITVLGSIALNAQNNTSVTIGYKTIGLSLETTAKNGLIFGVMATVVDSKIVEKKINKFDFNRSEHNLRTKFIPASFFIIGGDFENICILGKIGTAYIDQDINAIKDKQKIFFAIGTMIDFRVSNRVKVRTSYDNVNAFLTGINIVL